MGVNGRSQSPLGETLGGMGAWGSGLNKAWRQSPHQSRRLYFEGW